MALREQISIYPNHSVAGEPLLVTLAGLVPADFRSAERGMAFAYADAVIAFSCDRRSTPAAKERQGRCFIVTRWDAFAANRLGAKVRFSSSLRLDPRLRGRTLDHEAIEGIGSIDVKGGDEVLAFYDDLPVWVSRDQQGDVVDLVSVPLPKIPTSESVFEHLNGGRFLELLPLLHFLRNVTAGLRWECPPLRACLMFDDPNLHWCSYGFLNYRSLIDRARSRGFHVALATVPLDTWFADRRTASLIRENERHVSLLIHGNNHTRAEFANAGFTALPSLAQSLKRIDRLERKTGVHVERVFAPPHSACAESAMHAMLSLGFQAACIDPWSLRHWNPGRKWPPTFGLGISELMAGFFPVLPRFKLSDSFEGGIVISAYLDRPIIPLAHHTTVRDGLEILDRIAALINSFEGVAWSGPEGMLRSNFLSRREQDRLLITPYSRCITFTVPQGIYTIILQPVEQSAGTNGEEVLILQEHAGRREQYRTGTESPIPVFPGDQIEMRWSVLGPIDYADVAILRTGFWPCSRRLLSEVRDRCLPLLSFGTRR